jgi:erythromycin esterase-like protein
VRRLPGMKVMMLCLLALLFVVSCSAQPELSREEMVRHVQTKAVALSDLNLSSETLEDLASHRVVVLGETHRLREHWEFLATLVEDLHGLGFRQVLIEAPHMAEWLYDDYVRGGVLVPELELPKFYEDRLAGIRYVNEGLEPGERIRVRAIDVNEEHHGGGQAFRDVLGSLVNILGEPGPVEAFTATPAGSPEEQRESIERLSASLRSESSTLSEEWGPEWFAHVEEMVEVERASIDIREYRQSDDDRATRAREEEMKELVESRLADDEGRAVINVGAHHAQKSPLMGTDQEWLGDYLAHRSETAEGSVFIIGFTSAETVLEPGAPGSPSNIMQSSPEDELLRLMAETWPDQNVYLPLDDPLFSEKRVAYNSEDVIYVVQLADVFDALFQYGVAHRMADS